MQTNLQKQKVYQWLPGNGSSLAVSFFFFKIVLRTPDMNSALLTKFYVPNIVLMPISTILYEKPVECVYLTLLKLYTC